MTPQQRELFGYLEQHVRSQQHAGVRVKVVTVGRPEWEQMGRPAMAAGVRVVPSAAPRGGRELRPVVSTKVS